MNESTVFTSGYPTADKTFIHCQDSTCYLKGTVCDGCEVEILDLAGKLIVRKKMDENLSWSMPDLKVAIIKIVSSQGIVYTEKYITGR